MNNQVLDTQLNLAFDATLEELEKSLDLVLRIEASQRCRDCQ